MVLAFLMTKTKLFRKLVSKQNFNLQDKILLSFIFGMIGIVGTYIGIPIRGAIANARVVGVFVGGLLGGPFVGILSGLIAGGHRFLTDIGGFTAFSCGLSTFVEGIMSGFLKRKIDSSDNRIIFVLISGIIAEIAQMIIILIFTKPFSATLELVKVISIPMIITNGIGIAIFIAIIDSVQKDLETEAAYQAQLALKVANKTLKYFRKGLNEDTAYEAAKIIKNMTGVKAVAFTDEDKILTHIGTGEDHHLPGSTVKTNLTKEVLKTGNYVIANKKEEIRCEHKKCKLKSAIIVPLKEQNKVIGALKLYKDEENSMTKVERELALGLGLIFSTQIELGKIDYQAELLAKSELKALQAQINPHFLFNAINTIISLVRTQPDNARALLIHLGNYFRNNLQEETNEVDLYKEIENVNSYLEIEKARFGDKLKVIFDIPEDIDCSLPPLILQPIVENAVKHGVLERVEGGTVLIKATDIEWATELMVKDDGVGISEELLSSLLKGNNNTLKIGIKNVNDRLRTKYGIGFGLNIESQLGIGTTVKMLIPKELRRVETV
ncbi:sensor histidine kinase [Schnuerera sp. xch1]|uniref:sensor histidine kinase n=1 Tax=Schnuerera sp. xch1 TaxID=2874283 RepID=UPI001CBAF936|nr:sensor histidine kinase [Schnuerera sp. xch1]MBZ2174505.1 sensor histidine kinase [Schnuerera sp. xch1]